MTIKTIWLLEGKENYRSCEQPTWQNPSTDKVYFAEQNAQNMKCLARGLCKHLRSNRKCNFIYLKCNNTDVAIYTTLLSAYLQVCI